MGMGWKLYSKEEVYRSICPKCEKECIVTYDTIDESDYPPFERDGGRITQHEGICQKDK